MKYSKKYLEKHFATKFKILLDSRYRGLAPRKRRTAFCKDFDNNFPQKDGGSVTQSCKNWFAHVSTPNLEKLMNICELLNCDIDYFLTEQDVFQKDACSASEYLGLSYDTVERMSNYDDKIKGLLNVIIFDNHNNSSEEYMKNADLLFDLLDSIHEYALNYSTSSIKYETTSGIEHEITDVKQIDTLLRNNSIRACGTILNTVCVEYRETRRYNNWLHMNRIIMNSSASSEEKDEMREKYHVPKKYNHSIPTHF